MKTPSISLGADIGGTFTDVAMTLAGRLYSAKVLTDHTAPEQSILDAVSIVTKQAGIGFGDLGMIIHGTTLATNALIERNGARTALCPRDRRLRSPAGSYRPLRAARYSTRSPTG